MVKNPPANAGDVGSIPGLGRSPGEENGNPLQNSCLDNYMDRRAWWARGGPHHVGTQQVSTDAGKESACSAGDLGSIPGSGRSPGEENGNPLQYSYLKNSTVRGPRQATVHGVPKSQIHLATKQ